MFQSEEAWTSIGVFLGSSGQLPTSPGPLAKYSLPFSLRLITKSQHELLVKSGFVPVLCLSETLKELNLAGRLCRLRGIIITPKTLHL